jgi:hypothetical protein
MRYEIMPDVVNEGKFVVLRDRHLRLSNKMMQSIGFLSLVNPFFAPVHHPLFAIGQSV